uniref:Retrotransposon gag domain-containing protein n=1 Tax=Chenopodium quinoa TaxID=63459 RepID=A0A803NCF0_CHEQI
MHKRFVPKSYKQKLFVKLNSLQQNSLSVEQYITEFEKLYLACGCREEEDQKCANFFLGLARHIRFACEMSSYETFDDLCLLAATVERQFNESKDSIVTASSSSKVWDSTSHHTISVPLL